MDSLLPPNTCPTCHETLRTAQGLSTHQKLIEECRHAYIAARSLQHDEAVALGLAAAAAGNRPLVRAADMLDPDGDLDLGDESIYGTDKLLLALDPQRPEAAVPDAHGEAQDNPGPAKRRRVEVEEVPDEEEGGLPQVPWVQDYPGDAGKTFDMGQTSFERIRRRKDKAGEDLWAPFECREEWELAEWLVTSGLSQANIEKYLKLEIVSPQSSEHDVSPPMQFTDSSFVDLRRRPVQSRPSEATTSSTRWSMLCRAGSRTGRLRCLKQWAMRWGKMGSRRRRDVRQ